MSKNRYNNEQHRKVERIDLRLSRNLIKILTLKHFILTSYQSSRIHSFLLAT